MPIYRRLTILLTLVCFSLAAAGTAQTISAKAYKKRAEALYSVGRYEGAAADFEAYRQLRPEDDKVWYPAAVSHYLVNQLPEAKELFEGLTRAGKKVPDELYLYLGRIEHYQGNYAAAARYYKRYLRTQDDDYYLAASLADDIRRAGFGVRMGTGSGALDGISENLGAKFNSSGDDFHPLLSPNYQDRMYFASARIGSAGGRRDAEGASDPEQGVYRADMYAARVEGGRWAGTEQMNSQLNGYANEVALDFAAEGQVLVFWRGNTLYSGDVYVDTFRQGVTERESYPPVWVDSPLDTRRGDNDLFLFDDTTALFVANLEGGEGGFDIYESHRSSTGWTAPRNLGPTINTPYDERSPWLAGDGRTLYFSSNRADRSLGGFDVLRSTFDDLGVRWTEPQNAGRSINTAGNELNFRLALSGLEGYYDSDDRATSHGGRDVYAAYLKERAVEQAEANDPVTFIGVLAEVARNRALAAASGESFGPGATRPRIPVSVTLTPLPYGTDGEATTTGNLERARSVLQFMEANPQARLMITAHSDDSDPARFRSYFGIKRAEKFAAYLAQRGISPDRLQLMSVGSSYPLAVNYVDGTASEQGQKLNRRLELSVDPGEAYALSRVYDDPRIPDAIASNQASIYRNLQHGVVFRIEVATIAQRYDNDKWLALPSPTVQAAGLGNDQYRYSAGAYATYASAAELRQELRRRSFPDARVVPYLNGLRLSEAEVTRFAPNYAELAAYLAASSAAAE